MTSIVAHNQNITEASVWLYLTEKGRENKKKPFKYWMNYSDLYFEITYVHPTHVFDVATLLTDAYSAFLQSVQIVVYDNDKKKDMPAHFSAEAAFTNPVIDDVNLITWTTLGWKIPFRSTICLPLDKIKYIQLFVNGWAIEFTLYAKASSKNKLDAGAPQLFSILGQLQRDALAPRHTGEYYNVAHYDATGSMVPVTPDEFSSSSHGTQSDPFSVASTPDYMPVDSPSTGFNPNMIDQIDPAVLESPNFSGNSIDTFDSIIDSYNPTQFEEEKKIASRNVVVSRNEFHEPISRKKVKKEEKESKKDFSRKRRSQSSLTNTSASPSSSVLTSNNTSEKEKAKAKASAVKQKKQAKPKLLTPKKENAKFTQYIPTSKLTEDMNKVSLDEKRQTAGAPLRAVDEVYESQPQALQAVVKHEITIVPTISHLELEPLADEDDFDALEESNDLEEGGEEVDSHTASQQLSNVTSSAIGLVKPAMLRAGKEIASSAIEENEKEENEELKADVNVVLLPNAKDAAEEELDDENDEYESDASSSDSEEDESEDEAVVPQQQNQQPVVFKLAPAKSVFERIAESTGMNHAAMDQVIKLEKENTKPKEGLAFINELHKDLRINNFPLNYYDHVLVFTDQYSVQSQRGFTFFVDKKNKMRFWKSPKIEISHENLEFNMYHHQHDKAVVSHEGVTCVLSVDVDMHDKDGFIAIVPQHVGLVIFVPYKFNSELYERYKNPPKE